MENNFKSFQNNTGLLTYTNLVNHIKLYEKRVKNCDRTLVTCSKITRFNTDDLTHQPIFRIVCDLVVVKTLTFVFHNAGVDEYGTYRQANRQICWAY